MKFNLLKILSRMKKVIFEFEKPEKAIFDLYSCLIVFEDEVGGHKFNNVVLGIHMFSTNQFMAAGKVIPKDKIISFANIDIEKLVKQVK